MPHIQWPMELEIEEGHSTIHYFLVVQGITFSNARPTVEAHNFELKPKLISMVQQAQLDGAPMDDPNLHLLVFLEVTLKLNGVCAMSLTFIYFPFY